MRKKVSDQNGPKKTMLEKLVNRGLEVPVDEKGEKLMGCASGGAVLVNRGNVPPLRNGEKGQA